MASESSACLGNGVIVTPRLAVRIADEAASDMQRLFDYNLTTFLLLETLTDRPRHEQHDKQQQALQHLEAKLDTLLHLVMQLLAQHDSAPPSQVVQLSAQGIEWASDEVHTPGQSCLLALYLEPEIPRPLRLPARVRTVDKRSESQRVCAQFMELDPQIAEHLDKWIFRCHRREIAQQRHPQ